VLKTLKKNQLYAKLKKCEFWPSKDNFLGHITPKEGISIDPMKIEATVNQSTLTNVTKVRCFLGMAGYYRLFTEGFLKIVLPITRFMWKNAKSEWSVNVK